MKLGTIEQGVSLYGFNQRYVERLEYTIEDCLAEVQGFGVQKFELVGAIFFEQYPRPRADEIDRVLTGAEHFSLTPFSYGGYIDKGRITGREPTDEDVLYWLTADLITARELGCEKLRAGDLPANLLPLVATLAEQYGIDVGIEVHAPSKPSDAGVQEMLAAFERIGSRRLGFVPDFGCFIERPAEPALQRYEREGASRELLEYIIANRHAGVTEGELYEDVKGRGGGQAERMAIADFFGFLSFAPADIDGFTTLLPWTHYFHSKFYHVTAELQDPTIPMERLLGAVVDARFSGVLMSEYEGHAFHLDDAHEQIERHLQLEQRILGDPAP